MGKHGYVLSHCGAMIEFRNHYRLEMNGKNMRNLAPINT